MELRMSDDVDAIAFAADLTVAWLANPHTRASSEDVSAFLTSVHSALGKLAAVEGEPAVEPTSAEYAPAVSVRKSLASRDRIISMIDGKPYASLKRHLRGHGLTPEQYRERYGLKADYPMVAPGYSEDRSATAKRLGLGRKPTQQAETAAPEVADVPAPEAKRSPRKRLGISGAKAAAKSHLGNAEDA
jgi:predicted transcriptional regulator